MLQADHLTKHYGAHVALDDLCLEVRRGEIFALLGANGAGKTTTTQLFLGLVAPTSGHARVDDLDVATSTQAARRLLAYIPDRLALYEEFTGIENLTYFLALGGLSFRDDELRELLVRAGLDATAANRRVATYSKGMRQKVGLALALGKNARAMLLDEPLSGLDPSAANSFCARLRALRDAGIAVLMATHDLFRARETADRVGIMCTGRLVVVVDTKDVTSAELERVYLDAVKA